MALLNDASLQLILDWEVGGGETYYLHHCISPIWPGEQSGVTIGVGYDLGYITPQEFAQHWGAYLEDVLLARLRDCCGTKGATAKSALDRLHDVQVPWTAASAVFDQVTIPRFYGLARSAFPGFDQLRENAQGALVSLVFNRGTSMVGPTRAEMRLIRQMVPGQNYEGIAGALESMKRLWPNSAGLRNRRDAEARLVRMP